MCSLGIEPTTCCAANAMLYHWATETHGKLSKVWRVYRNLKGKFNENIQPHDVSNVYGLLSSAEPKNIYFKDFFLQWKSMGSKTTQDIHCIEGEICTIHFSKSSFVFHRRKSYRFKNYMRISKWHNLNFCANDPFNLPHICRIADFVNAPTSKWTRLKKSSNA